jgi:tetratricopeptide (TPR) repeat protein
MRALGRCLLIAAILASAQGASAVEKRPTAAEEAEIRGLEKELTGLQIKQAYLAAIPIARKLYELQREATGADSRAARSRQNVLGTMLQSAGRTTDALVIYEEMLRTAEAQYGRASRETMQSLGSINSVYWSQSRYDDAYPVMQRMLEITRKLDGEQSQMYANQLSQLGTLFNMRSEFSAAHTAVFQQAIKDSTKLLDPSVLTHVTRLHEIEADREGMVMAFLAGYQPRGGIEFMELMGKQREIPKHLDHPTFQERIDYLTDFWTNDVRYAFVSFKLGVAAMDRGDQLEESDLPAAVAAYQAATEHFKRFHTMLPSLKEAMNDLGVAYTKLGVLAMDRNDSPLGRWQTRFSLERESSVKYADLVGDEGARHSRGLDGHDCRRSCATPSPLSRRRWPTTRTTTRRGSTWRPPTWPPVSSTTPAPCSARSWRSPTSPRGTSSSCAGWRSPKRRSTRRPGWPSSTPTDSPPTGAPRSTTAPRPWSSAARRPTPRRPISSTRSSSPAAPGPRPPRRRPPSSDGGRSAAHPGAASSSDTAGKPAVITASIVFTSVSNTIPSSEMICTSVLSGYERLTARSSSSRRA